MTENDNWEREFDHRWANSAEHKEPSARARMLAARWKENPPNPAPFRADPDPAPRRSSWASTAMVFGCVIAVMVLIGLVQFGSAH
ncbi:membrane protein [Streptomyces roseochromogenus]|uniref:Membrane protein n=1 Tax=Streptomyces roseochromogenus subsp. oscitans DS 12.976 TaxID=1352936 RepID=V6JUJ8_STRRC|nr:membrane protein [Streptomyces roseochromogenus]EST23585.1 membrane protein [Streptomyces roseochromogenus subsp. oscitans DS 12.976]